MLNISSSTPSVELACFVLPTIDASIISEDLPRFSMDQHYSIKDVCDNVCCHTVELSKSKTISRAVVNHGKRVAVELLKFISVIHLPKTIGMLSLPSYPFYTLSFNLGGSTEIMLSQYSLD